MRIKINNYSSSKFCKNGNLYYDTSKNVLYYKIGRSLKEMPNQKKNIKKLERVLSKYDDDSDVRLKEKERDLLLYLQKNNKKSVKKINSVLRKTKKNILGIF